MSTVNVNEQVQDNGHDSASEEAKAAPEPPKAKRSPTYHVFELQTLLRVADATEADGTVDRFTVESKGVKAWVQIAENVQAATDRLAIVSVIGTEEKPVEGFDAKRRMRPHWAPLIAEYEPRTRTRKVHEDWA